MKLKQNLKNIYVKYFKSQKTKYKIVSLGGGCDLKLFMINPLLPHYRTEFFDFLWNFDGGLKTVKRIFEDEFRGFSNQKDYFYGDHPKFDKNLELDINTGEVSLQHIERGEKYYIPKKYKDIAFMHYEDINWIVGKYPERIKRFKKLIMKKNIFFVYYRQFDEPINSIYVNNKNYEIEDKIEFWKRECFEFIEYFKDINPNAKLLSLFVLPHDFEKDKIKNLLPENKNGLIFFDYLFYKNLNPDDHKSIQDEMKRIFRKYLV